MGNKEELKTTILEAVVREKNASARHMTGTEDLLKAMNSVDSKADMNSVEAKPETKKPHKTHWQQIVIACCCILAIAAAVKAFLYLDTEIGTVQSAVGSAIKELNTLNAQRTAVADTKEQLAAVTAEIKDLKAINTQLRAEVKEIREAFEVSKAKKNNVVPAQQKRR